VKQSIPTDMILSHISNTIYPLPEASIQKLEEHISEVSFPKGHILLRANKVESSIYFIKKGIARLYTQTPDNEITFLFCKEGDTLMSLKSYVTGQKGYEDVELLEDCELYQLKTEVLEDLYQSDIHIAN
jgi:CRP-like cAMP-binding protein